LSAAASVFCRDTTDDLPTTSDAVARPYFSEPAIRSRSSQQPATRSSFHRADSSGPACGYRSPIPVGVPARTSVILPRSRIRGDSIIPTTRPCPERDPSRKVDERAERGGSGTRTGPSTKVVSAARSAVPPRGHRPTAPIAGSPGTGPERVAPWSWAGAAVTPVDYRSLPLCLDRGARRTVTSAPAGPS
jgi:hypothetical protein